MRDEVERYRSPIETAGASAKQEFAAALVTSLTSLVAMASRLPNVSPTDRPLPDRRSHAEWKDRLDAIQNALDHWDVYWTTMKATNGYDAPEAVS
jgi:hypothetical protein